jgi:hypothetical protein
MSDAKVSMRARLMRRPWYMLFQFIRSRMYEGKEYTIHIPLGKRMLTPWWNTDVAGDFNDIYREVLAAGKTTTTPDRFYMLYQLLQQALLLEGDIAECGVYVGGTAQMFGRVVKASKKPKKVHLFDTFEGFPDIADPTRDYHNPGEYNDTSLEMVKKRLAPYSDVCEFHPGFIPDTFSEIQNVPKFCLVNVDVDLYPTTQASCEFFWSRMSVGGIMIFNDYGMYAYRYSTRKAVDEFFAKQSERPLILPSGQAIVIKTGA